MANEAKPGFKGLRLYNTLTRKKQDFVPLNPANVRMYVCGPTVYDFAHIGNARPIIVFDVLFRLLRHLYGPEHVTYARNITDVDDKIIARAAEEGVAVDEVTARTTRQFHEDVAALGCLEPTFEPRATEHIPQMIEMIERLIENGCAYVAARGVEGEARQGQEGVHVLFDVTAFADYGKLSNRSTDEMIAGARVEVAPYKNNPMDFVLWKPSKQGEPAWDSPWGRGRPGWHLECSAMSAALLGESFDIHGGGIDLVFPHHENEIAQSRCAHGTEWMARYWLHNGYLQVEGEKMSKSLGNFVTVRELLDGWEGYSWPGEALRFNMLRTHYRQPLDWTLHGLDESHKVLFDWYRQIERHKTKTDIPHTVVEALSDDLNTPKAIAEMHKLANKGAHDQLLSALNLMGFSGRLENIQRRPLGVEINVPLAKLTISASAPQVLATQLSKDEIEQLVDARAAARAAKNWAEADRIRDELVAMGIVLMDRPDGTTEWEVAR